jgi:hypothetical protein
LLLARANGPRGSCQKTSVSGGYIPPKTAAESKALVEVVSGMFLLTCQDRRRYLRGFPSNLRRSKKSPRDNIKFQTQI